MWFETLTGFSEISAEQVRANLVLNDDRLYSKVNQQSWTCGKLETPNLETLRARVAQSNAQRGKISLREVVANVRDLHADPHHAGAFFQVASQFNLLEMTSPSVTPEYGVGIYEYDHTQGPSCAIAAGAGTIYRNYFAEVEGQLGQTETRQIDCLADIGKVLGNENQRLWFMRNGYALASANGLQQISDILNQADEATRDSIMQKLRIGIQWHTQVTLPNTQHLVTQAYCSALPVGYSQHPTALWADFARLILQASYEATVCAAIINATETGNHQLFLTLIGGGVFGNEIDWILEAIQRALNRYQDYQLDVAIVSYRSNKSFLQPLLEQF